MYGNICMTWCQYCPRLAINTQTCFYALNTGRIPRKPRTLSSAHRPPWAGPMSMRLGLAGRLGGERWDGAAETRQSAPQSCHWFAGQTPQGVAGRRAVRRPDATPPAPSAPDSAPITPLSTGPPHRNGQPLSLQYILLFIFLPPPLSLSPLFLSLSFSFSLPLSLTSLFQFPYPFPLFLLALSLFHVCFPPALALN